MQLAFANSVPLIGIRQARFSANAAPSLSVRSTISSRQADRADGGGDSARRCSKPSISPQKPIKPVYPPPTKLQPGPIVDEPSRLRKRERNPTALATQSDYDRVMQLSWRRDKRAARQMFRACTATYPCDGRLWLAWAQMESRIGNKLAARRIFASGVDVNPENVHLLHAWAVFEERADRFDDARRLLRRCISLAPGDGMSWQGLALLYQRNGDIEKARETFQHGVSADDLNASLWSAWAVLEHRQEKYDQATELFEKALEINPNHSVSLQAYAITAEKLGEMHKSEDLFKQALRVAPKSVPTYQAFAMFEARRDNLDKARELFRCGLNISSKHAAIWHAWAVMEQEAGNHDAARDLFQKGISAVPKSTPLLRAWARMELELGHIDKGMDWRVPRGGYKPTQRNNSATDQSSGLRRSEGDENSSRKPSDRFRRNNMETKQISTVAENLVMLRLMIERKSDDDVRTVMKWLDGRAKADRELYDALAERQSNDVRVVQEWVGRRSSEDIKSFRKWLDDRYEKDRRIGVYVFNWDLPPLSQSAPPAESVEQVSVNDVEKPVEWLHLDEVPEKSLQSFDEDVYFDQETPDYYEGLYFVNRVAGGLADRAVLALCLGAMAFCLVGTSSALNHLGYSPAGTQTQLTVDPSSEIPPPSGVDAHLYEEGGAEAVVDKISIQTFGKLSSGKGTAP